MEKGHSENSCKVSVVDYDMNVMTTCTGISVIRGVSWFTRAAYKRRGCVKGGEHEKLNTHLLMMNWYMVHLVLLTLACLFDLIMVVGQKNSHLRQLSSCLRYPGKSLTATGNKTTKVVYWFALFKVRQV